MGDVASEAAHMLHSAGPPIDTSKKMSANISGGGAKLDAKFQNPSKTFENPPFVRQNIA